MPFYDIDYCTRPLVDIDTCFLKILLTLYVFLRIFFMYLSLLHACVVYREMEDRLDTFGSVALLEEIYYNMSLLDNVSQQIEVRLSKHDRPYQPSLYLGERSKL